jgi:hypothetical protein
MMENSSPAENVMAEPPLVANVNVPDVEMLAVPTLLPFFFMVNTAVDVGLVPTAPFELLKFAGNPAVLRLLGMRT